MANGKTPTCCTGSGVGALDFFFFQLGCAETFCQAQQEHWEYPVICVSPRAARTWAGKESAAVTHCKVVDLAFGAGSDASLRAPSTATLELFPLQLPLFQMDFSAHHLPGLHFWSQSAD